MPTRRMRGIALIAVLWLLVLLAAIAQSFSFTSRSDALAAGNVVSVAKAEALADSGIFRGIYEVAKGVAAPQAWAPDGRTHLLEEDGETVSVTILDEGGKIDLNAANDRLLLGLMASVGLAPGEAQQLLDTIKDWRDPDDLRNLRGAEKDDYHAAGRRDGPSNSPFKRVEELRQVLGMTESLYRRLEPALTVSSGATGINSRTAPAEALLALPGATPATVDAYLLQRQASLGAGVAPLPFPLAQAFETDSANGTVAIRADARLRNGAVFAREAIIRLGTSDPATPFAIVAWRDRALPPQAASGKGANTEEGSNAEK